MTVLIFIAVLVVLIVVHEFGHFIAAKWVGMRVDEFGIGFAPRLWGVRWGETLYSINAIPFGGFVKIYGEDPGGPGQVLEPRAFGARPKWQQALVLVAGILMNLVLAWLLFAAILMTSHWVSDHEIERGLTLFPALYQSTIVTLETTKLIFFGLVSFFAGIFTFSADLSQVTGPIGIAGAVGSAAAAGWQTLASLTALISINLALINLIPIPALDGGRLLFVIIETITRRPIKPAFANALTTVSFVLLLLLMLVVSLHDVYKIFV